MKANTLVNRFASTSPLKDSIKTTITNENDEVVGTYYLNNHKQPFNEYAHFRFILKPDGSLWHDGNLFMLHKIKKNSNFSNASFQRYEQALREFIAYCEESHTDYWHPREEYDAPTDRFKKHLENTDRSATTGEKLMPVITAFYEWMKERNGFSNDIPLWREKTIKNPRPENGRGEYITIKDVCKFDGNNQKSDGVYLYDGGKLRPLTREEEKIILNTVNEIGNPEFKILFPLALMTYARKQTLLTLRLHHILDAIKGNKINSLPATLDEVENWKRSIRWPEDLEELSIIVGKGHNADVKGGKTNYTITIRGWLWKRIVTYMVSERAFSRRKLAIPQKSEVDQYLFLTSHGNAMYHAKSDLNYNDRKELGLEDLHTGNALDQFMKTLRERLRLKGHDIEFHFHCLRATGGVRFLENRSNNKKGYANRTAWLMDIQALQKLMNHADISSTWHYLEYLYYSEKIPETVKKADKYQLEIMSLYDSGTKNRLT
jgi:hypothetical protein